MSKDNCLKLLEQFIVIIQFCVCFCTNSKKNVSNVSTTSNISVLFAIYTDCIVGESGKHICHGGCKFFVFILYNTFSSDK